ncbi:DUF4365 domain-containing protein [Xanthomonas campestris pv. olitorii]|nr:DUF4365 domain-containing protein [Xanthomonas campestris pv. olitorii]
MAFPKYGHTNSQERLGVNSVAEAVARMGLIWREIFSADVGIDGHIEYVAPDGAATGRLVAVQIKSGPSFLKEKEGSWIFYPDEKHQFYWERFPLPVLVVLHDPDRGISYWQDVRRHFRTPVAKQAGILVPKGNVLQNAHPNELFQDFAASDEPFLELDGVLGFLIQKKSNNGSFPISFFDLFCNGLTNICRSIYFGMDVALTVAEIKLERIDSPFGAGVGDAEHEFMFDFIKFLVHQHLADLDFSDCLIDWHDRQMMPTFMAPLTSRGRALVERIGDLQTEMEKKGAINTSGELRAVQEDFVQMVFAPSHIKRVVLIDEISTMIERNH